MDDLVKDFLQESTENLDRLDQEFVQLEVPVQTVDATPSGIKQFSKVVFMRPGIRFGLSAEQKTDVWRRWRAGQT
ncbi:MAG TPA: hypothetical protein VL128_04850, partial [Candidatus Eisenbacteria bacterium]|nr:hypothetical protein [Candidatus Eisenbacteria bacterium]